MNPKTEGARVPIPAELLLKFRLGMRDRQCSLWAEDAAARVDGLPHGIVVALDGDSSDHETATIAARGVAEAIIAALGRRWSLDRLMPEYGPLQTTSVGHDRRTRTLLPHHDGGNSSYLTPSRLDVPEWPVEDRRTFPTRVTTTRAHKLYQGFLVQTVGGGESVTPYYDLVTLLMLAFRHQTGAACSSVVSLQKWCAGNLSYAMGMIRARGDGYIQLGALLGARNPRHVLVNLHNLNDGFSEAELSEFPEIAPHGSAVSNPAAKLFDEIILETTGLCWPEACMTAERRLETGKFDLVFGHNILLMHGGINGGADRLLDPICAVIEQPSGQAYEHWLAEAWRTAYWRAPSVSGEAFASSAPG
jgi:hypothetical protein